MKSFHNFVSSVPPGGNPGNVTSSNWNDSHLSGMVPTAYSASGIIPTSVDYIRATGGVGGIALQLTPNNAPVFTGPSGAFTVMQVYFAKKVDSGAGPIVFTDINGALIEGAASYQLTQQGQWAIFVQIAGGGWEVFGGQAA